MPEMTGSNDETTRAGFHYDIRACDTEDGVWVEWWFPERADVSPDDVIVEGAPDSIGNAMRAAAMLSTFSRPPKEEREPDGHCFIPVWAFAGLREEMAYVEYRAKDRDDA